jgi:hypothetical protein
MPIDRGTIDQQLRALGETSRWDERELRDLPTVLHADETITAISRGKIARLRWMRRSWLIVVTNERLLCLRSSGRSWRQLEVSASQIARVALRIGVFRGRVIVLTTGSTYRLLVPRWDAYKLLTALSGLAQSGEQAISGFGPTRIARRVIDHVLAMPAAALDPQPQGPSTHRALPDPARERRLDMLEEQVQQLQQQVDFLEQLLRERQMLTGVSEE